MNTSRIDREDIFHTAADIDDPTERRVYLDSVCGDDQQLRADIDSLLRSDRDAGGFLQSPVLETCVRLDESAVMENPGTVIGRYKLLEKIGEGGMAVVYMAEQEQPLRRRVALKIIKLGMDTRQVIARFEAERQALAMMDHPCIAKVLDAGATETGRPYFVMELVQGLSITEYCDRNSLGMKDRLRLFLHVCQAVQHAHQKGIIHRDLKPSNVMVTHHDGQPIPKVIDFGIAKAINQKLTEKTLFTRYAHLIGTPAYMSPEQAELSDLDIDTRSDIYSLGVLLYELLTGTTPFSEEELRKAGYLEMQRVIREQEPVKPSTRITTLGDTSAEIAKRRSCTAELLRKTLRGDLDWIVMKALEKDRTRRYETAGVLAEEVRRHLASEPVLARSPSAAYGMRKFLDRHRSGVLAALGIAVIAIAAAVLLLQWNRDRQRLNESKGLRDAAVLSQARELYAKGERQTALETIAPILHSRHVGPEARLLYAGILVEGHQSEEAVAIVRRLLGERPAIAGAAHSLLARILWESESLDGEKLKQIDEHHQKAKALLPETAEAYFLQAMTAITIRDQLTSLNSALELDTHHYESRRLRAFVYYASRKYGQLCDDALVMTILRPGDSVGYSLRATACRELGRYSEAMAEYDKAMAWVSKGSREYLDLAAKRSEILLQLGDYEQAIADAQRILRLSPESPVFRYHLFGALTAIGDYERAAALFQQIVTSGSDSRRQFGNWCGNHVFDTLEAKRSWHPPDRKPMGAAFLPMVEAEETYHQLSAKAKRIITNGFTTRWSPDGKKLAFSMGVVGYNGVAIYDPDTKETELLIVPGKDPAWSPDGRYIAFVRDCQALRVPEFTAAARRSMRRPARDEEVWVMKSDGTEPRRLARGGWPSWSQDSTCVYYQSLVDNTLYSFPIMGPGTEPKKMMPCSYPGATVSPDGQYVVYQEGASLKVKNVASQSLLAEWPVPFNMWGRPAWSPAGDELAIGTGGARTGLCIFRLDRSRPVKVLSGQIMAASWAPDGTKLVFHLGAPHWGIWCAELDPNTSVAESLGPCQTPEEYFREMVGFCTRRISADPTDPNNYLRRAEYYESLREEAKGRADTRRYRAALDPGFPTSLPRRGPWTAMQSVNGPFGCQLVIFLERQEDGLVLLRIAFGQKGRCEMKSLEVPMMVTSLVGFCLLSGLEAPPARANFTFGKAVNLGSTVNSSGDELIPVVSWDGLELYFVSYRRGGLGESDIWMSKRASVGDPWGAPVHLAHLNSAGWDYVGSISSDGLTLYIGQALKAGDLYTATRPTKDAPWGRPVDMGPVLNRPYGRGGEEGWGMEDGPIISPDDLELFFTSDRLGTLGARDIFVSTRATPLDPWGPPENLGPTVNSPTGEMATAVSPDGLILFMMPVDPNGGPGVFLDTWMTRRAYKGAAWSEPVDLGPSFNTVHRDAVTSISPDGRWIYFDSDRPGGSGGLDLWMAPIVPTVDFNHDGKLDLVDLVMLIDNWGTNNTLYDIGPYAWGDGKVDIEDLKVFIAEWEKENPPVQP